MPMTHAEQMQRLLGLTRAAFAACDGFVMPHIRLCDTKQMHTIHSSAAVEILDPIDFNEGVAVYPLPCPRDPSDPGYVSSWVIDDETGHIAVEPDQRSIVLAAVSLYFEAKITPALDAWEAAQDRSRDTEDAVKFLRDLTAIDSEVA